MALFRQCLQFVTGGNQALVDGQIVYALNGKAGRHGSEVSHGTVWRKRMTLTFASRLNAIKRRLSVLEKSTIPDKRPLYVYRKLLNGAALAKWAKSVGLPTTMPADEMHVTVLYSKRPVDWFAMDTGYGYDTGGGLTVQPGGPRALDIFEHGDTRALVLRFKAWDIEAHHRNMIEAGASSDFPDYKPHITITYAAPADFDPEKVTAYSGALVFGPAIFEAIADGGFDPDGLEKQKRWPAGQSKGGQFAPGGAGGGGSMKGGSPYKGEGHAPPPDWGKLAQYKAGTGSTPGTLKPAGGGTGGYKPNAYHPKPSHPAYAAEGHGAYVPKPQGPPPGAKPHPVAGGDGKPVIVNYPTKASAPDTWHDHTKTATFLPGGDVPGTLNGVRLAPWTDHPTTRHGWATVEGQSAEVERSALPLARVPGKHVAAGVIIEEPDGRIWLCRPTNSYGGYDNTFPKGSAEEGHGLQATAIKEAFEETGLKIQITGVLGDYERSTSVARMYTAKRVGGTPKAMGWESQAMRLAPRHALSKLLNTKLDRGIADDHAMEFDLGKALGTALPVTSPAALSFAAVIMAGIAKAKGASPSKGGAWEKQPRWPAGPNGGQWKQYDADGVLMPPKLGSEQNPVYTKKGAALYGMAKVGDTGALKLQADALAAKVAAIPAGKTLNFHDKQYAKLAEYATALSGLASTTPKADASAFVVSGMIISLGDYKKVGEKPGGTNPGAMYQDADGAKWLAKGNLNYTNGNVTGAQSNDRAHSEVLTAKLLQAVGVGAPDMKVVDFKGAHGTATGLTSKGGNLGVISKWVPGGEKFNMANPAHMAAAQADFAVHAWLANWDSIGTGKDNTVIIGGKAVCIDPGGALGFRAQGLPKYKDGKLPTTVSELTTLRDPSKNADAADVYGKMTPAQLKASAEKLSGIDNATIKALVTAHGPGSDADKADMTAALIARRDYVLAALGAAPVAGKAAPVAPVAAIPADAPAVVKVPAAPVSAPLFAPMATSFNASAPATIEGGIITHYKNQMDSAVSSGNAAAIADALAAIKTAHVNAGTHPSAAMNELLAYGMTAAGHAAPAKTAHDVAVMPAHNIGGSVGVAVTDNALKMNANFGLGNKGAVHGLTVLASQKANGYLDGSAKSNAWKANAAYGVKLLAAMDAAKRGPAVIGVDPAKPGSDRTVVTINGKAITVPNHGAMGLADTMAAAHTKLAGELTQAALAGDKAALVDKRDYIASISEGVGPGHKAHAALAANLAYGNKLLDAMNGTPAAPAGPVMPVHVEVEGLKKNTVVILNHTANAMKDMAAAGDVAGLKQKIATADHLTTHSGSAARGAANAKNAAYGKALLASMGSTPAAGPVEPVHVEAEGGLSKNAALAMNFRATKMTQVAAAGDHARLAELVKLSEIMHSNSLKGDNPARTEANAKNVAYGKALLAAMGGAPAAAPAAPSPLDNFALQPAKAKEGPGMTAHIATVLNSNVDSMISHALTNDAEGLKYQIGLAEKSLKNVVDHTPEVKAALRANVEYGKSLLKDIPGQAPAGPVAAEGLPPKPAFGKVPDLTAAQLKNFNDVAEAALALHAAGNIGALEAGAAVHVNASGDNAYVAASKMTAQYASDLALDLKEKAAARADKATDNVAMMPTASATPAGGLVNPFAGGNHGPMVTNMAEKIHEAHAAKDVAALEAAESLLSDMMVGKSGGPFEVAHNYAKAALADLAGHGPSLSPTAMTIPSFPGGNPKTQSYYQGLAADMAETHAKGQLSVLKMLATKKGGPAWPVNSVNGKIMAEYHNKLVADLEAKAGVKTAAAHKMADDAAGFPISSAPPRVKAAAVLGMGVAPPMAMPAKPKVSSPANPNAGLATKLDNIEQLVAAYQAGTIPKESAIAGIGHYTFGSNTYGKAGAKYQAGVIAALSGAQAPAAVVSAPKASKAAPAAKPGKAIIPKLSGDSLPKEQVFTASSKAHVNEQNQLVQTQMKALAEAGDYAGLAALTYKVVDKETGNETGEVKPVSSHPAKNIVGYQDAALQAMREILNPPKPLQVFAVTKATTIEAVGKAFPPAPHKTNADKLPSNQKFGQWAALGQVANPEPYTPKFKAGMTPAQVDAGAAAYKGYSASTKNFVSMIQANSAMNHAYRAGKETHNGVNLKAMAKQAIKDATPMSAGTTIYRWQDMTPAMIQSIKGAKPGLILDSLGPMCASYSSTATSHFGNHKINIIAAEGAKAIHSHGSGGFKSEKEVSILPGSRFVFLGYKAKPGGAIEMDLLMLPPHDTLD